MGGNPTVSSSHICIWVKDFLPNSIFTLSTGSAQGCVLSPLLYSQYTYMHTYNCTWTNPPNTIRKFACDTTMLKLVSAGGKSAYRARQRTWQFTARKQSKSSQTSGRAAQTPLPVTINGVSIILNTAVASSPKPHMVCKHHSIGLTRLSSVFTWGYWSRTVWK